jgi:hypothetical protein
MNKNSIIPDYTHSILGLPNAFLEHYGAGPVHASLPLLQERLRAKNYRNIVYMVFDGMGADLLRSVLPRNAFLNRHTAADIFSVYPCTTTAALTTLESGFSPIEHGWLGWCCYFKEIWQCVTLFSGHTGGIAEGVPAAKEHIARKLLAYPSIFEKIHDGGNRPDKVCLVSPFTEYRAHTSGEVCAWVKTLCAEPGRHFIYTYNAQPDHDMHDYGCYDERIRFMMAGLSAQLSALCAALKDTLVVVTADHGLRNVKMVCIEDYPHLSECLLLPPTIEPRCVSLFIRDGFAERFKERFINTFGDEFLLLTKEEALRRQIFGPVNGDWEPFIPAGKIGNPVPGVPHPKALDFIGDYLAVAVGDIGITYRDNHGEYNDFKASHAGLDKKEMEVPLVLAET